MTRIPTLIILAVVALAACVQVGSTPPPPAVTGAGEIPFTLEGAGGAAIVVPVKINGQGPYQLVLDTGATFTCLDQSIVKTLDLPTPTGMVGRGATVGSSGAISLHRIDTLTIGDVTAKGLTACALDLRNVNEMGLEVDGLLGLNVLKSFKVGLDFGRNVLTLSQP